MKIIVNPRPCRPADSSKFPALVQSERGRAVYLLLNDQEALVLRVPSDSVWYVGQITPGPAEFFRRGELYPFHGSITFEAP